MPPVRPWIHAGLVILASGIRLAAWLDPPPINIDEARYLVAAHHLRTGVGYSDWRGAEIDIHPLHPWLVSVLGMPGSSLEARGRALTLVCSLLLLVPLGLLAADLGGGVALAIFLLLAGAHPWLAMAAAPVQPESLYVFLVACALCLLCAECPERISGWRWALSGTLFGLAYLARPEGILVGPLAGVVALSRDDHLRPRTFIRYGVFVVAAVTAASPYLLFLRRVTGEWTIAGKTAELFFAGQAFYDAGGLPDETWSYLALMDRWQGILPYVAAHPGVVLSRVAHNLMVIWGWLLPLGLGPAGLAGILGCAILCLRRKSLRGRILLIACPSLTLVLMLFTFKNQRVAASVLPFLFVISSVGLVAIAERFSLLEGGPRTRASAALVFVVMAWWAPAAWRVVTRGRSSWPDRQAARLAVLAAGSADRVASNNPALSYYVGDPLLFGPPGRYRPLDREASCLDLAVDLRQRGARVAVLDGERSSRETGAGMDGCPLRLVATLDDPATDRRIRILALP